MAKWSVLKEAEIPCKTNTPSHHLIKDRVLDDSKIEFLSTLRSNFFKTLVFFLKEIENRPCVDPFLVKLGDGQLLDLFNLYCTVRKRGGYEIVTQIGDWGSVVRELGLHYATAASLKLIHFKYLCNFDLWLGGIDKFDSDLNLSSLAVELEMGFRSFLSDGIEERHKRSFIVNQKRNMSHEQLDYHVQCVLNCQPNIDDLDDDDENCCVSGDGDLAILTTRPPEVKPQKRKRESFHKMLAWVVDVAKHSNDPAIGIIPEPSKLREHASEELWVQAISVRDALCRKQWQLGPENQESLSEKKAKMHPSMYEDDYSNHPYSERFRCRESRPTRSQAQVFGSLASCNGSMQNHANPTEGQLRDDLNKSSCHLDDAKSSIGPLFQAEVPEWKGIALESDSKWLGTKVWPLETDNGYNDSIKIQSLGKGRSDSCSCPFRGSVECVRLHIAENRLKLKLELGSVFYQWRFDHMGEDVSLRWTVEEERRFKEIQNKWYFPGKRSENLVSYYCNAFLLRRRRYQNRVTPKDIDSDDDDSEFGSFGNSSFQNKLAEVTGFVPCLENKQCSIMDIDEKDME